VQLKGKEVKKGSVFAGIKLRREDSYIGVGNNHIGLWKQQ
jgi:hypothetical protein